VSILGTYAERHLAERYENLPRGRYASLILLRVAESEAIFRTEGSGEDLSKEVVSAGRESSGPISRVVISKRKQTAVERRTGRELLRHHRKLGQVTIGAKGKEQQVDCPLNMNKPCGRCIDCILYGYAVGGGAQKARLMTEDAFSLLGTVQVTGRRTGNATFDNGTMRNPVTGDPSTSIYEDEYVVPGTHFVDIETLKDVTFGELEYVLGNVLRSRRYGAISSRMGEMRNEVLAVVFSDCEIFSALELTQAAYDVLAQRGEPAHPLPDATVRAAVEGSIDGLMSTVFSREPAVLRGEELLHALAELQEVYRSDEGQLTMLARATAGYPEPV